MLTTVHLANRFVGGAFSAMNVKNGSNKKSKAVLSLVADNKWLVSGKHYTLKATSPCQ